MNQRLSQTNQVKPVTFAANQIIDLLLAQINQNKQLSNKKIEIIHEQQD